MWMENVKRHYRQLSFILAQKSLKRKKEWLQETLDKDGEGGGKGVV